MNKKIKIDVIKRIQQLKYKQHLNEIHDAILKEEGPLELLEQENEQFAQTYESESMNPSDWNGN